MSWHDELVDASLHVPGYVQAGDPGAVGAGMLWYDTSINSLKIRNATDTGWETAQQTPLSHTHIEDDVTDLGTYLTETAADLLYAALSHTHIEDDITDLDKYTQTEVDGLIGTEIQGDDIYSSISPTDGQVLTWDAANSRWDADDAAGSSDPAVIPHYNKGTGAFNVNCLNGLAVDVDPGNAILTCRDVIHTMSGGVASPSYTFKIAKAGGSYGAGNSDPTAEYLTLTTSDDEVTFISVHVTDGTSSRDIETYVIVQQTPP